MRIKNGIPARDCNIKGEYDIVKVTPTKFGSPYMNNMKSSLLSGCVVLLSDSSNSNNMIELMLDFDESVQLCRDQDFNNNPIVKFEFNQWVEVNDDKDVRMYVKVEFQNGYVMALEALDAYCTILT